MSISKQRRCSKHIVSIQFPYKVPYLGFPSLILLPCSLFLFPSFSFSFSLLSSSSPQMVCPNLHKAKNEIFGLIHLLKLRPCLANPFLLSFPIFVIWPFISLLFTLQFIHISILTYNISSYVTQVLNWKITNLSLTFV